MAAAILFGGSAWIWNLGASRIALTQRGYPVAAADCKGSQPCEQKAQIDGRAAAAADTALYVALGQLVASLLGLGGVGYTVFYARLAWREAKRSATAAHDALDDAREDAAEQEKRFAEQIKIAADIAVAATKQANVVEDTARKQLRAYVYAESISFQWMSAGYPIFTIVLRNSGQTPALRVKCGAQVSFGDRPTLARLNDVPTDILLAGNALIGSGSPHETTLLIGEYRDIRREQISDDHMLAVVGRITYADVFGDTYETEFGYFTINPDARGMSQLSGRHAMFRQTSADAD